MHPFSIDTAVANCGGDLNVFNLLQIEYIGISGKTVRLTSLNFSENAARWTTYDRINTTFEEERATATIYDISSEYASVGRFSYKRGGLVLELYLISGEQEDHIKKASFFM
jgi:hypothetical protein